MKKVLTQIVNFVKSIFTIKQKQVEIKPDYKKLALTIVLYLASIKIIVSKQDYNSLIVYLQNPNNRFGNIEEMTKFICESYAIDTNSIHYKYIFTSIANFKNGSL